MKWTHLVWQIPQIVVYVVGIVLAVRYWQKHPRVSFLSLAGFCLLLLMAVFPPYTLTFLRERFQAASIIRATSVFYALALGMIVAAVFTQREATATAVNIFRLASGPPSLISTLGSFGIGRCGLR